MKRPTHSDKQMQYLQLLKNGPGHTPVIDQPNPNKTPPIRVPLFRYFFLNINTSFQMYMNAISLG
ncbi:MAG: hypothetical protein ACI86M_000219 [Saprospiraceae bacterium]|jgi:hypothetical protein